MNTDPFKLMRECPIPVLRAIVEGGPDAWEHEGGDMTHVFTLRLDVPGYGEYGLGCTGYDDRDAVRTRDEIMRFAELALAKRTSPSPSGG